MTARPRNDGAIPGQQEFLPYGRQSIDENDIQAVIQTLRGRLITTGPQAEEFERKLAEYCGARHAIVVSNGTAALHVAMLAARVKPGDRVLTSPNTFLASANCAEFVGATADFADIDPETYNVTAETLRTAWKADVRAVIPVDFAGQPCQMPPIAALARERGAIIVEDGSHAIGSRFEHEGHWYKVGGHPWADMTTFSFHPVKTITSGEGGAILTNDGELAERCRLFRNHGMVKDPAGFQGLSSDPCPQPTEIGPWYYEMQEVGFNYRITDIQCALVLSQLRKLDRFARRRAEIVARYNTAFASFPHIRVPFAQPNTRSVWHLYVIQLDFASLHKTRTQVMSELHARGIGTQVHYIPVHLQPYYRRRHDYQPGKCPVAEAYYQRCLSLPLFPAMTDADVHRVIDAVISTCSS